MNSTWRRQFLNNLPTLGQDQSERDNHRLQELNSLIKLLRRKEDLVYRAADVQRRSEQHIDIQIHLSLLKKQIEHLKMSQLHLLRLLEDTSGRIISRTLFSRVVEILEISKQRMKAIDLRMAALIDNQRRSISELYNKLLFQNNYDVVCLISHLGKAGAERVAASLHYKSRPHDNKDNDSLTPSRKRSNSQALLKVTGGFAKPSIPNFLEILSARKMMILEMEEKRSKKKQQLKKIQKQDILNLVERPTRKKYNKEKPKKVFTTLYSLLGVKNIFVDEMFQDAPDIEKIQQQLYKDKIDKNEEARLTIATYRDSYETYANKKQIKLRATKSKILQEPHKRRLLPSIGQDLNDF